MGTLLLIRHAKTEQLGAGGGVDHGRELTHRGRRDGAALGDWLAERDLVPDLVLCSTATRAAQTWQVIAAALAGQGGGPEVWPDRRIYSGDPDSLLACLRDAPSERDVVAMVGHLPSVALLGLHLADVDSSEPGTRQTVAEHVPTGTAMVLRTERSWADQGPGTASLTEVHTARG